MIFVEFLFLLLELPVTLAVMFVCLIVTIGVVVAIPVDWILHQIKVSKLFVSFSGAAL